MKKIFLSLFISSLLISASYAECMMSSPCYQKVDESKNTTNCDNNCSKTKKCEKCEKCMVDDDEYCVYNQCYFDKHFRIMKQKLCLSSQQECNIDALYKKFKSDMEFLHSKYRTQKNRVLFMIECSDDCYKEEASELKDLRNEMKDRLKCFKQDVKAQLCKEQYKAFRKFNRQEKRRVKRIIKYGAIYKFPCKSCCN